MRCYLKYKKHEITLNVYSPDRKVSNMPLDNSTAIPLYKGTDSIIDFIIKDNDRKPVSMVGKNIQAYIMNVHTKQHILTIPLYAIDDTKGFYQVIIPKQEIQTWETGYYHLVVSMIDELGIEQPLFNEYGYHVQTILKVNEMVMDYFKESNEQIPNQWLEVDDYLISSSIPSNNSISTIVFYMTNYSGNVMIQISLADIPPVNDNEWSVIYNNNFLNFSGLSYENVVGNFKWIRIKHKYDVTNIGTFDKVLTRSI